MTYVGCGPKLALLCLPYIILSLIVMFRYPEFFNLEFLDLASFKMSGISMVRAGNYLLDLFSDTLS